MPQLKKISDKFQFKVKRRSYLDTAREALVSNVA